jgi:hypothetical protein
VHAIRPYLAEVGLAPHTLTQRGRPLALLDVVDTGDTFGLLLRFVKEWSDEASVEWRPPARKIRIVGLTWREKTSPKTRRWQQHAEWVDELRPSEIKISLPSRLATYLAADAPKTSSPFTPSRWGDEGVTKPMRQDEAREALGLAVRLFDFGRLRETRLRFARALAREPAMTEKWFRSLILEIRR